MAVCQSMAHRCCFSHVCISVMTELSLEISVIADFAVISLIFCIFVH